MFWEILQKLAELHSIVRGALGAIKGVGMHWGAGRECRYSGASMGIVALGAPRVSGGIGAVGAIRGVGCQGALGAGTECRYSGASRG